MCQERAVFWYTLAATGNASPFLPLVELGHWGGRHLGCDIHLSGHPLNISFPPPTSMSAKRACLACRWVPPHRNSIQAGYANLFRSQDQKSGEFRSASVKVVRSDRRLRRHSQKCVPGTLRCVRCTKMGIEDCVYDNVKKRGVGKTLKTGQACAYCR